MLQFKEFTMLGCAGSGHTRVSSVVVVDIDVGLARPVVASIDDFGLHYLQVCCCSMMGVRSSKEIILSSTYKFPSVYLLWCVAIVYLRIVH